MENKEAMDLIQQGLNMLPDDIKRDLLAPVSKETGKGLASLISLVSYPVNYLNIHANAKLKMLELKTQEKIEQKKSSGVYTEEKLGLAVKAIEESRYQLDSEILQDFFSELISNSVDRTHIEQITPYFAFVLSNMTEEEAKFLQRIKALDYYAIPLVSIKLTDDNKQRGLEIIKDIVLLSTDEYLEAESVLNTLQSFGLLNVSYGSALAHAKYIKLYEYFENSAMYKKIKLDSQHQIYLTKGLTNIEIRKGMVKLTDLGISFLEIVVV